MNYNKWLDSVTRLFIPRKTKLENKRFDMAERIFDFPKPLYDTNMNEGVSDTTLNAKNEQANIKGLFCYQGLKLENCRVNGVPIRLDLYRKQKTLGGSPTQANYGLVTHAFVRRLFQITSSGGVVCNYA